MVKCGIFGVVKSKHGKEGYGTHTGYSIHNMVVKYVTTWRGVVFCGIVCSLVWCGIVCSLVLCGKYAHWHCVVSMLIGIVW